jgi:hypothetical protein
MIHPVTVNAGDGNDKTQDDPDERLHLCGFDDKETGSCPGCAENSLPGISPL